VVETASAGYNLTVERYRIEWRQGPTLVANESWVIDLNLLMGVRSTPFRLVKHLQVVVPLEDLDESGVTVDWPFWRAVVAQVARTVVTRLEDDRLHLDRPREPFQLVPDVTEAAKRATGMATAPIEPDELLSELVAD
jgi:hypothetical protein